VSKLLASLAYALLNDIAASAHLLSGHALAAHHLLLLEEELLLLLLLKDTMLKDLLELVLDILR